MCIHVAKIVSLLLSCNLLTKCQVTSSISLLTRCRAVACDFACPTPLHLHVQLPTSRTGSIRHHPILAVLKRRITQEVREDFALNGLMLLVPLHCVFLRGKDLSASCLRQSRWEWNRAVSHNPPTCHEPQHPVKFLSSCQVVIR